MTRPMFTRRHHKAIAEALHSTAFRQDKTEDERLAILEAASSLGDMLENDNPNFNRTTFIYYVYGGKD